LTKGLLRRKKHSLQKIISLMIIISLIPYISAENSNTILETEIEKISSEPIEIFSDADFGPSGYNLPGSGTSGDPYKIEKHNIVTDAEYAVYVSEVTSYFVVESNSLKGTKGGLYLSSILPGHVSISNNSFNQIEAGIGIKIYSADQIEIRNNNFLNTFTAIECTLSSNVIITDNDIRFNHNAFTLTDSPGADISNNEILSLTGNSIELINSQFSQIRLNHINESGTAIILKSNYVKIFNNILYANNQGILIEQSIASEVYDNFIYHNFGGAIYVSTIIQNLRKDNVFYHNYFVANTDGDNPQAISAGTNNTWYNSLLSEGNYWSDANKTGPYYLEGEVDLYPLNTTDRDGDGLDDINEKYVYFTDLNFNDTDLDGLLDGEEVYTYFTIPTDSDTDNDRLNDGEEVLIYGTDPLDFDTDDDLLDDYEEIIIYNTDPFNPDTDGDGIPDGWEVLKGLDPLIDDSTVDYDDDGLSNLDEYYLGTHPYLNDTDFDNLIDGDEVLIYDTDPLDRDSDDDGLYDGDEVLIHLTDPLNPDSDNDTLSDGVEVNVYSTNPLSNDSDVDGMPDPWEIEYELDPLFDDSSYDNDTDNLTNLEEFLNGCDPTNNDTDSDGYLDGHEVRVGTDPLDPLSHPLALKWQLTIIIGSSVLGLAVLTSLFFVIKKRIVK